MRTEPFEGQWRELAEGVITGMTEWRQQHPRATLAEIEAALDARLARLRAQMLQDAALASAATQWREAPEGLRPAARPARRRWSPAGGGPGIWKRRGEWRSPWSAVTASAPPARRGFSPLDRELALLPGHLT